MNTRIDINIERIILEDFPAGGEAIIKRAIESELKRLFAGHESDDLNSQLDNYRLVSGKEIVMPNGAGHESVGRQIAQSIFKELTG